MKAKSREYLPFLSFRFTVDLRDILIDKYYLGNLLQYPQRMVFSFALRFWLYLIPNSLSIVCSIFVLYHLLSEVKARRALHNHVIIILLCTNLLFELTDVLWIVHYYHFRYTVIQTPSFALIWTFIDYSCYYLQALLFAWATIERHFLIFHHRWMNTQANRLLLHYLPISLILVYCFAYYLVIFFVPFCENSFDYSQMFGLKSIHCIYANPFIPEWDLMFNQIVPALIIVVCSLALLMRVLWQKHRLFRSIHWRQQRKMMFQLLSITLIYLIFNVPCSLYYLAYHVGLLSSLNGQISFYLGFFAYYLAFLFPFVCCGTLPKLTMKMKKLLRWQHRDGSVRPVV